MPLITKTLHFIAIHQMMPQYAADHENIALSRTVGVDGSLLLQVQS